LLHPIIADTLPGFEVTSWTGIGAPKGVSEEIVVRLNREICCFGRSSDEGRFAELGGVVFPTSPADFGTFVAEDRERWGKVIRAAGIKAE